MVARCYVTPPKSANVLADPAASYWLQNAIRQCLARDPVDALCDIETLYRIVKAERARCFDER